jgi:hypothetical protein
MGGLTNRTEWSLGRSQGRPQLPPARGPFLWAVKVACTGTGGVPVTGCMCGLGFTAVLPPSKSSRAGGELSGQNSSL